MASLSNILQTTVSFSSSYNINQIRRSSVQIIIINYGRHIYPSLVLVQTRKTRPCFTERLLMGRKKSNQTKTAPIGACWLGSTRFAPTYVNQ